MCFDFRAEFGFRQRKTSESKLWPYVGCFFFFKILFICCQREEESEGEKHPGVVAFHMPPTGDLACNPVMCPDWESNQ